MGAGGRIWRRLGEAARRAGSRRCRWPGGVVSFTFDDFPASALFRGGEILRRHGARGTYYASCGLAGGEGPVGALFALEDLRLAREAGHEVACHTFSHLNCAEADAATLATEAKRNAAAFADVLGGDAPSSFAYPFGAVSAAAKRALGQRFSSCRGIQPGLNQGAVDFGDLKANKIYDREYGPMRLRGLVDENRARGGWLIFYTHDVAEKPSPYGCSPEQFEAVVAYAAQRSAAVLPVGEVVRRLRG